MMRLVVGARSTGGTPDWASQLAAIAELHAGAVLSTSDAVIAAVKQHVGSGHRTVVACGAELDHGHILNVLAACSELGADVIAVLAPTDAALIHDVMLGGASGYRFQPGPFEPLVEDIQKVAGRPRPSTSGSRPSMQSGRVITVTGNGGAGKTAIATRLAAVAARSRPPDQVSLVDLNLSFGAADIAFGVLPERTVANILTAVGELERRDLLHATVATADGVRYLASPSELDQAALVQGSKVTSMLGDFRRAFELTVVDTASYIDDILVAALRYADLSIVVVTPDLVSVRNGLRLCDMLRRLGIPRERVGVVVNGVRSGVQTSISDKEIRAVFSEQVMGTLPVMAGLRADCSTVDDRLAGLAAGACAEFLTPLALAIGKTVGLNLGTTGQQRGSAQVGIHTARRTGPWWSFEFARRALEVKK